LRLFINDIELDLPKNFVIARTKQVNDIGRLDNRQANFSQKVKLPKTKKNKLAFNNLGDGASVSTIPYERNGIFLYNHTGECEIFNGWGVVENTNKYYNLTIYDGAIDFYKAIDNKVLTDIGVSDLNHTKNTASVVASWSASSPYRYIVADYNGKVFFFDSGNQILNIDYLVPCVNVKWLWDRVFSFFGFTYTGAVFQIEEFTNLWMTFPKGVNNSAIAPQLIYQNTNFSSAPDRELDGSIYRYYLNHINPSPTLGTFLAGNNTYLVDQDGTYRFEMIGSITVDIEIAPGLISANQPANVLLRINTAPGQNPNGDLSLQQGQTVRWFASYPLFNNDTISSINFSNDFEIKIYKLDGEIIDFENALIDFKVKDFLNEILWRFNLTPFKDKYTNNIDFLTLGQRLQNTNYYDWSDRYTGQVNEKYIYSNYGQQNNLKYKYNDQESDFNDGKLLINNVNLPDNVDVIKSNIYSPNKEKNEIYDSLYNVYPLWQKEANEGTSNINIKYKSLDKRYYFLRSEDITQSGFIGSESLTESQSFTGYPRERYTRLPFQDIVQDYYMQMYGILNETKLIEANIRLDDNLVNNIDFKRLVFIKQLSNYYIINKIPNYVSKGVYKVELIRVKYSSVVQPTNSFIVITNYNPINNELTFVVNDYEPNTAILQISSDNGITWNSGGVTVISPKNLVLNSGDKVRFKHNTEDLYSNTYTI
jgi:hypothetical protein